MEPALLSNRYQIVRPIGTGELTRVLQAWDRLADRPVAIKIPIGQFATDKAFLVRLEREAVALAGFTHPNVAAVHTVERDAGFVVAELVDGASLGDMLAGRGPLPPRGAARLTGTVCAALAAAHAQGIVHGHLTPSNVLLTVDGQVKLTDFRLAHAARPLAGAADPAADLRALGRLLAAMLTGRQPADGEPVRLGPEVPAGLAAIVARADGPERPYRLAAEVGRDLDRFLASVRPGAGPADQRDMPLAHDAPAAVVASPAADLVTSPTGSGSRQLRAARGVARPSARRRRIRTVAAGLVGASVVVGGVVAGGRLLDRGPGGAAAGVGQATVAPPSTVVRAPTTSRPQPATSTSTATSRAPATTVQPTIAALAAAATVTSRPTATTGRMVGPGQRIVPDVVGLHPQQAAHVLAQAQLGMQSLLVQIRDPDQVRRVIAQQPPVGQVVSAGSKVTVLVGTIRPTSL
jgi:eukaryotic-like serine/threonine-protein kinase